MVILVCWREWALFRTVFGWIYPICIKMLESITPHFIINKQGAFNTAHMTCKEFSFAKRKFSMFFESMDVCHCVCVTCGISGKSGHPQRGLTADDAPGMIGRPQIVASWNSFSLGLWKCLLLKRRFAMLIPARESSTFGLSRKLGTPKTLIYYGLSWVSFLIDGHLWVYTIFIQRPPHVRVDVFFQSPFTLSSHQFHSFNRHVLGLPWFSTWIDVSSWLVSGYKSCLGNLYFLLWKWFYGLTNGGQL